MSTIELLEKGYKNFRKNLDSDTRKQYANLATGQSPETLMITCSDSRIDPCQCTGTKAGELFVIRNAGNIVPVSLQGASSDLGTLQFAVEVLKVKNIVVCGHSDCGAVKAMMSPDSVKSLPALSEWIDIAAKDFEAKTDLSVIDNAKLNTLHQIKRLESLDFVKPLIESNALTLHAWIFDIGDAAIEKFNFETSSWTPLACD